MEKNEKINGIRQFAVVNIPWQIDWESLEISKDEDKELFIKNFTENIIYKPLMSYNPNNIDDNSENKIIGVVEDVSQKSDDVLELFCAMWVVVTPEYNMISNVDNMNNPLGLRLTPNGICIQFDKGLNKAYTEASQLHAGLATKMREALDPDFSKMLEEYRRNIEKNESEENEESDINE